MKTGMGMGFRTLCLVLAAFLQAGTAGAETVLRLAGSWNILQNFTADFMEYVEAVNERGRGLVRIEFLGGPEVIPEQQLLYALRRGVVDLAFGGMTYYRGVLPEGDALFATTLSPEEARESGALEALQPWWARRVNAHLIGWVQTSVGANVWLREAPAYGPDGLPDLRGLIIRTSPSNRELLLALGARAVQIPVSEIYTALERGMVDGLAFTTIGMPDLGVDRFIRHRIDPPVLRLAVAVQANRDAWERLPPAAREILESEAAAYEVRNRQRFQELAARERRQLEAGGLTVHELPSPARERYQRLAFDVVWARMARRSPAAAAELKPLFYPESVRARQSRTQLP
jgi:TRAP-type C4-dicarboxylate transport system substrate-binding protein